MRGTALCAAQSRFFRPVGAFLAALWVIFAVEFYFYSLIQSESLHPLGTDFPRTGGKCRIATKGGAGGA